MQNGWSRELFIKKTKVLSSQNQTSFKIYIHTDNNINKEDALVYRTTHVVNIPKYYVYKSKRNEGTEKIVTKNWKLKTNISGNKFYKTRKRNNESLKKGNKKRTQRNHEHKSFFFFQMTTLAWWKFKRNFVEYMFFEKGQFCFCNLWIFFSFSVFRKHSIQHGSI